MMRLLFEGGPGTPPSVREREEKKARVVKDSCMIAVLFASRNIVVVRRLFSCEIGWRHI